MTRPIADTFANKLPSLKTPKQFHEEYQRFHRTIAEKRLNNELSYYSTLIEIELESLDATEDFHMLDLSEQLGAIRTKSELIVHLKNYTRKYGYDLQFHTDAITLTEIRATNSLTLIDDIATDSGMEN